MRAKGAWRAKAVAKAVASSAGTALYQLTQGDEDDEDDDSASEDDDDQGEATPFEEQVETLVEQAVESLSAVAEPALALIELIHCGA